MATAPITSDFSPNPAGPVPALGGLDMDALMADGAFGDLGARSSSVLP